MEQDRQTPIQAGSHDGKVYCTYARKKHVEHVCLIRTRSHHGERVERRLRKDMRILEEHEGKGHMVTPGLAAARVQRRKSKRSGPGGAQIHSHHTDDRRGKQHLTGSRCLQCYQRAWKWACRSLLLLQDAAQRRGAGCSIQDAGMQQHNLPWSIGPHVCNGLCACKP